MTELIIPVKPLEIAKQRLAGVLTPSQRASLVLAMLQDLLDTVSGIPELTTWVVSNDHEVLELTRRYACRVIEEPIVEGYNSAVTLGLLTVTRQCKSDVNVAIVPADIPLASVADLSILAGATTSGSSTVRLAPSHDKRGTNGVFLSSSNLLRPSFGENSFRRYRTMSQSANIIPEILTGSTLALDIDNPVDLEQLLKHDSQSAAASYLHSLAGGCNKHVIHRR